MQVSVSVIFADLCASNIPAAYSKSLDDRIAEDENGQVALREGARLVDSLRDAEPEFVRLTSAHPDSYWPILVFLCSPAELASELSRPNVISYASIGFEVTWDYGVVYADRADWADLLTHRAMTLLGHWAEIRRSIEQSRSLIDDLDNRSSTKSQEARATLRHARGQLLSSLMRSDQRSACVWEFEVRFLDAAMTNWGLREYEVTAERTLSVASEHLDRIAEEEASLRSAELVLSNRRTRQLLFLFTLASAIATLVAALDFASSPDSLLPTNPARWATVVAAFVGVLLGFSLLRESTMNDSD